MKGHIFLKNENTSNEKIGLKQLLNKDIKEFNTVILSLLCIGFLIAVGIISYKVNTSYAVFTDTIKGEKTIELTVTSSDGGMSVYSWNTSIVSLGATKDLITGYTTDYTALSKNFFLKHNLASDNIVESNEVCYILNGTIYCLKGGSADYYEENSATLLTSIGEDNCSVDSDRIECSMSGFTAGAYNDGRVAALDSNWGCGVDSNGDAFCMEL